MDRRRVRISLFRGAVVLLAWTLLALLLAAQAWFAGEVRGEPAAWWRLFAIWLAWAGCWAMLTPAVLALAARVPLASAKLGQALLVHAVAGCGFAFANLALFATVAPYVGAISTGPTWLETLTRLIGTAFLLDLPVYWVLVGGSSAFALARRTVERERNALRLQAQLNEARLVALRSQLEPHFLFNALNTVTVLMREDVDAAERIMLRLAALLRRTLDAGAADRVALRDELAFVEAYLEVEQARFADRLDYRIDCDPAALDVEVPSLVLQPLVENAVRHGLARRAGPGRIEVQARSADGMLTLRVRDDGPGPPPSPREGIGLSNTRARLGLLYGDRHVFELRALPEGGAEATLRFPLRGEP